MTHDERIQMRKTIYEHLGILLSKVHEMFSANDKLTPQQMSVGADILKDISKSDSALSKACYYDSLKGDTDDRRY